MDCCDTSAQHPILILRGGGASRHEKLKLRRRSAQHGPELIYPKDLPPPPDSLLGKYHGPAHRDDGRDFPDALSAGPAAACAGSPLVLVDGTAAGGAPETEAWLAASAGRLAASMLVGGAAAITDDVGAHVDQLIGTSASR